MGKQSSVNHLAPAYLPWVGVLVVGLLAFLLNIPDPKLDWDGFVLPATNRYAGTTLSPTSTPLTGINVVISGSTSGIGRGMTEAMAKLGASVIAMGRNPTKLEQLRTELAGLPGSITTVIADYQDLDSVARAADAINQLSQGRIDILLNNAGIHEGILLLDNPVSQQGYDRIFSVNYLAHFLLTEKLAPSLLQSIRRPIVAQMSSSFHWVGDWSDLIPGPDGSPPPASRVGGTGGIFRTQRGYGNSKLAMIFHARALKRRNVNLNNTKTKIVRYVHLRADCWKFSFQVPFLFTSFFGFLFDYCSICPAWVGTNIMPKGTVGHLVIKHLGFQYNGWGIASTLYAMFSDDDQNDYFSNSRALNLVAVSDEMAHVRQKERIVL
jgi:NAD(P)-dependent dehydrogenase (short-subunit alcohol dehydrogenase family)